MAYKINFEFLDNDAIENAITCLNYEMDKVIFFGEEELINQKRESLRKFLPECCNVGKRAGLSPEEAVTFVAVSDNSLEDVIKDMHDVITSEEKKGNQLFFDITGGEGMTLLAFGILAKELGKPMHLYDVETGKLKEFFADGVQNISVAGKKHSPKWDLDVFVKMQGGEIDEKRSKAHKTHHTKDEIKDLENLWNVCKKYRRYWTGFSSLLAFFKAEGKSLIYTGSIESIRAKLDSEHFGQRKVDKEWIVEREAMPLFKEMLKACKEEGLLTRLEEKTNKGNTKTLSYTYKSEFMFSCLTEAGNALEQHVYLKEMAKNPIDCRMGIHINWENGKTSPVINEVDVFVLQGYVPVFISCKAGKSDKLSNDDLYELETIAQRFGGKYAKKVFSIINEWYDTQKERAADMGIEVRVE